MPRSTAPSVKTTTPLGVTFAHNPRNYETEPPGSQTTVPPTMRGSPCARDVCSYRRQRTLGVMIRKRKTKQKESSPTPQRWLSQDRTELFCGRGMKVLPSSLEKAEVAVGIRAGVGASKHSPAPKHSPQPQNNPPSESQNTPLPENTPPIMLCRII